VTVGRSDGRTVGLILAAAAGLLSIRPTVRQSDQVLLATTTSTRDAGLLDSLLPIFERQTGYRVKLIAVGSGQALELGRRGDADVVLSHAPQAERVLADSGYFLNRRLVMHNDFLIVGPAADPAGLRGLNQKRAYTISDRATYLAWRDKVQLVPQVEGDSLLYNVYHVMEVNPRNAPRVNTAGGKAFADFLVAPATQALIGDFGKSRFGQSLFLPDAGKPDRW